MRTTITISQDLLEKAQALGGKAGYSDAIVTSIEDYVALCRQLSLSKSSSSTRLRPPTRA